MTGVEVLDVLVAEGWVRLDRTVRRGPVWVRALGDGSTVVGVGGTEWPAETALTLARSLSLLVST